MLVWRLSGSTTFCNRLSSGPPANVPVPGFYMICQQQEVWGLRISQPDFLARQPDFERRRNAPVKVRWTSEV